MLRTPLLPFDEFERWTASPGTADPTAGAAGLGAAAAPDRARPTERLRAIADRPEIGDALYVASPSLHGAVRGWLDDPGDEQSRRVAVALVSYLARMTARPTPFGLFAGTSVGGLADRTSLHTAGRSEYRRHTRPDMDYLDALGRALEKDPDVRPVLRFWPNSSLYAAGGRLRYTEARLGGTLRYSTWWPSNEPTTWTRRWTARGAGPRLRTWRRRWWTATSRRRRRAGSSRS